MNGLWDASIQRYDLADPPYAGIKALDPIDIPDHDGQIVTTAVDDFDETILQPLADAHQQEKPVFFLVSGRSRSGRSTIANCILHRHCALRKIDAHRFVVPKKISSREASGHDPFDLYKEWINTWLYFSLKSKKIDIPRAVGKQLNEVIKTADEDNYIRLFSEFIESTHQKLRDANKSAGFGVCIEDIRNIAHVDAGLQIFRFVPVAVVFTIVLPPTKQEDPNDSISDIVTTLKDPLREYHNQIHFVDLHPLTDVVVAETAKLRWNGVAPAPFDDGVFDGAFDKKRPTFGRTLSILARLVQAKAANAPADITWPDDQLRYTGDQVRQTLPALATDF